MAWNPLHTVLLPLVLVFSSPPVIYQPAIPVLPQVRNALGVGDRTWEACNMEVHEDMMGGEGCRPGGAVLVASGRQNMALSQRQADEWRRFHSRLEPHPALQTGESRIRQ